MLDSYTKSSLQQSVPTTSMITPFAPFSPPTPRSSPIAESIPTMTRSTYASFSVLESVGKPETRCMSLSSPFSMVSVFKYNLRRMTSRDQRRVRRAARSTCPCCQRLLHFHSGVRVEPRLAPIKIQRVSSRSKYSDGMLRRRLFQRYKPRSRQEVQSDQEMPVHSGAVGEIHSQQNRLTTIKNG